MIWESGVRFVQVCDDVGYFTTVAVDFKHDDRVLAGRPLAGSFKCTFNHDGFKSLFSKLFGTDWPHVSQGGLSNMYKRHISFSNCIW